MALGIIKEKVKLALSGLPQSSGRRLLVTGGPTCEDIDDVRFITNRSTGRMGIEIAREAAAGGWQVLLVLGPTCLRAPERDGITCVNVRSAEDMHEAVTTALPWCDVLVMSAAVADYTPAEPVAGKLKKSDGELVLRLKRTPDILRSVSEHPARAGKTVIGFALEADLNLDEAHRKLRDKRLDAILANTVAAFGEGSSRSFLITADSAEDLGEPTKQEIAAKLLGVAGG